MVLVEADRDAHPVTGASGFVGRALVAELAEARTFRASRDAAARGHFPSIGLTERQRGYQDILSIARFQPKESAYLLC